MLDKQLIWVTTLLQDSGIHYWLDSGTLLGICRGGALIEGDNDIDLSVWEEDEPALRALLPEIRAAGYRILPTSYQGVTYKFKCYPRAEGHTRTLDFLIYRKDSDFAWAPQRRTRPNPYERPGPRHYAYKALRRLHDWYYREHARERRLESWPVSKLWEVRTWWIPAAMFESRSTLEIGSARLEIPRDWEDYLAFRYGDWKTPNRGWSYWADDGGLAHLHPSQRAELLRNAR